MNKFIDKILFARITLESKGSFRGEEWKIESKHKPDYRDRYDDDR